MFLIRIAQSICRKKLVDKQENGVDFKAYKDYKRSKSDVDLLLL